MLRILVQEGGDIRTSIFFQSGRPSHPTPWIGNVVGDPLQQPDTGGILQQVIYMFDRQKTLEESRW